MKFKMLVLSFCSFLFLNCQSQNSDFKTIDPKLFSEKVDNAQSAQLLDVRTSQEFASSHLAKATNIDWNGSDFEVKTSKLDKNEPVYVYCKSGTRSAKAANKLHEMGFKEIYNLDGGIVKWQAQGFEVTN